MGSINDHIPRLGHALSQEDVYIITEAIKTRQEKFPDENIETTVPFILINIGDRYVPYRCVEKEWRGYKKDLIARGEATCPNGHELLREKGVRLGWVMDNS